MDTQFKALSDQFIENLLRESPINATDLGDHRYDHLLDQVDAAARERQAKAAKNLLSTLEKIDFGRLARENQVDYLILKRSLEEDLWELEELRSWEWNPLIYARLAGDAIYSLLAREGIPLRNRLKNAGARCRELPRFFEQTRASLSPAKVPPIHAETVAGQNKGILSLLDALLVPQLEKLPDEERKRLDEAIEIARHAVENHQQWIEKELVPNAKGNPRLSESLYREKFDFSVHGRFTPEELRKRAEAFLTQTHDRMYALSRSILLDRERGRSIPENASPEEKRKLIRECLEIAAADAPGRDGVVAAAKESLRLTEAFVRERDLITLPGDPVKIIIMPEFRRGVALAYCDAPGPLEVGEETFYAVSPPPAKWTDEQVRSHLREYNHRSLHNLTVHEAMPGHFVQLALANRYPGRLRAILSSGTFVEGWAVYSEWMMVEEGFLAGDDLMKLVVLKWYLRDVTNALIDQAVHLGGIEEKEAMELLMDQAFQEEREAAGKFRRAQLTSGQLSTYFAGYLELVDLRKAAEAAWGDEFNLKTYHDQVLSFGSPPAAMVQALLLNQPVSVSGDL